MKVLNASLISAVLASPLVSQKCSDRIMKIEIDSIEVNHIFIYLKISFYSFPEFIIWKIVSS